MVCDVRTSRTPARHWKSILAALGLVFALSLPCVAQAIHPELQHGRIVWTNDGASETTVHPVARSVRSAPHYYYYWSNVEHRWKPVKAASPHAMRSARAIAGEVSSYIQSRPRLKQGEMASQDPNYSKAAQGRSVSSSQIDHYIEEASAQHNVDPNLVRALIKVESNYNPKAVSSKGAMGLMQLMPATARMYDVQNPFDARQNVEAGVRHLRGLLDDFRGNVPLTLAAYNAGAGAVRRSKGIPPYTETRNYVRRITRIMQDGSALPAATVVAAPIKMHRDARGILVISNTE
jgi:soluble lytic murein transglycosylase-like protein